jgi:hypothetical protein
VEALELNGLWAYLRDRPGEAAVFSRATEAKASGEIATPLAAYDFTRFATIADIGGGRGAGCRPCWRPSRPINGSATGFSGPRWA